MLAGLIALLLAAAAPPQVALPGGAPEKLPPVTTVSPVTVTPNPVKGSALPPPDATVDVASDDGATGQFVSFWPAAAYASRADGHVRLNCLVDVHGLAEQCAVAAESPEGKGFGDAALELRPSFKITPLNGADGKPVKAVMSSGGQLPRAARLPGDGSLLTRASSAIRWR